MLLLCAKVSYVVKTRQSENMIPQMPQKFTGIMSSSALYCCTANHDFFFG